MPTTPLRLAALAALAVAPSCIGVVGPRVVGSGTPATEERDVGPFERLRVEGDLDVVARLGSGPGLEVTCDDNLLPYVETRVDGDVLEVWLKRGYRYRFRHDVELDVGHPGLRGVELAGAGHLTVHGVDAEEFVARAAGSGDVVAHGSVGHLDAHLHGSGDLELAGLAATTARVTIRGSGDAVLTVDEVVGASIHGSGTVRYHGPARARDVRVHGSGSVLPVD